MKNKWLWTHYHWGRLLGISLHSRPCHAKGIANISGFTSDLITHPCPDFNGGLAKQLLKSGHRWVITSHSLYIYIYITHPCHNHDVGLGYPDMESLQWRYISVMTSHSPAVRLFVQQLRVQLTSRKQQSPTLTDLCGGIHWRYHFIITIT